jgi:antitoxin component YwqK of YwqJK toxin-antitoxin module
MLADGLVVTRAGGRTVDGRVCATQPYVYETYKYEYSFQGGILHGSTKTYSGDNLLSEVVYENGERVLQITYDDDEQIETPYADGKVEGIVKSYYNGKLNMESTYANGRLNGLNKGYCSNGTLCSETNYVNGVKEGSAKEYHSDGVLKRDYTYKNDKYEGYRKEFNEDGSLKGQILYQDGEPISGSCANGKPLTETELSIEWYYDYDEE